MTTGLASSHDYLESFLQHANSIYNRIVIEIDDWLYC